MRDAPAAACRRLALLSAAAVLGLATSCRHAPPPAPPPPATYAKPFTPNTGHGPAPPSLPFTDVTAASGIDFAHVNGASGRKWLPETMGSGVAMLDYDGDGRLDLFFVQGRPWPNEAKGALPTPKLYRNLGGWKFEDVTARTGVGIPVVGMGVSVADYDGDGDPDLFVTCVGRNLLLRNDGGVFHDVAAQAGVTGGTWKDASGHEHPSWSMASAWLDADGDGRLDLFVAEYVRWSPETDVFTTADGKTKAYTIPTSYPAGTCHLYRNLGGGRFEDVGEKAGVAMPTAKSLGVAEADVNGDGRLDLAVANDTQPNSLFLSQPGFGFKESALAAGVAYDETGRARAGMGVDFADLKGDGTLALAVGNFSREPVSLYESDTRGFFVDHAAPAGLARDTLLPLTFGLLFVDLDLDGALDLELANGHIEPDIHAVEQDVTYAQPPLLFWNRGDGTFANVSASGGPAFQAPIVGRGLAAGDLDGDGDLDLVITTNGGRPLVLRNDQALQHHWLRVRAIGAGPRRDAIGTLLTLRASGRTQRRFVRSGSSYLSESDRAVTFGLGAAGTVDDLEVRWPDGRDEHVRVDAVDRVLDLHETAG